MVDPLRVSFVRLLFFLAWSLWIASDDSDPFAVRRNKKMLHVDLDLFGFLRRFCLDWRKCIRILRGIDYRLNFQIKWARFTAFHGQPIELCMLGAFGQEKDGIPIGHP